MLHVFKRMMGVLKKVVLVFVVFSFVLMVFSYFIDRDKTVTIEAVTKKNRDKIYAYVNDPALNSTAAGKRQIKFYRSFMCKFVGEACTDNPDDGDKYLTQSFAGKLSSLLVLPISTPPASGVYWVYNGLQNAGFVPKTYAAEGIGFAGIKPLIGLWTVFRDISYLILVLILLVIGFMIMFRMKLNPQTVISVENALPKIVITLILITFSFAIAGFLIDMMYVLIAVGISLLSKSGSTTYFDATKFQNEYMYSGMGKIFTSMYPKENPWYESGVFFLTYMGNSFLGLLDPVIQTVIRAIAGIFGWIWIGPNIVSPLWAGMEKLLGGISIAAESIGTLPDAVILFFSNHGARLLGGILGSVFLPQLLLGLGVFFTMVYLWFRIFFLLFRAYLQILLYIVFAPAFILMEAVPTGKSAFASWLKNLLAEILTFPIVILLLVVGYVLVNSLPNDGHLWAPPFLASSINKGIDAEAYGVLLSMGIIFLIPDLVAQAKQALGVKGAPVSVGLGTFFGGVGAATSGGMGVATQFSSLAMVFPILRTKLSGIKAGGIGKLFEQAPTAGGQPLKDKTGAPGSG